jgi:erythronate-4-phosphate dehydrogenase
MLLLIDDAIEHAHLFAPIGDLRPFPGRNIQPAALADAEALIIRSVTRIDESLLSAAPNLRFIGTLTTGTDHIDTAAVTLRGITLADAAGANSRAVAEYVIAAILHLAESQNFTPSQKTLGIIGLGRIGTLVGSFASALTMPVIACDPPLAELRGNSAIPLIPLPDLLSRADIITVHVPLTHTGPYATHHLLNADFFSALRPGAILINTSRGEVLEESAALHFVPQCRSLSRPRRDASVPSSLVLDVWPHEPHINEHLLAATALATPHIAGQTTDARLSAAHMIRDALQAWLHLPIASPADQSTSPRIKISVAPETIAATPWQTLARIIQPIADLTNISTQLKTDSHAASFDTLRRRSSSHREFPAHLLEGLHDPQTIQLATELGFAIA